MPKLNQKGAIHLLIPLLLLGGIVVAVYLVNNAGPLKIFPKASISSPISGPIPPVTPSPTPQVYNPQVTTSNMLTQGRDDQDFNIIFYTNGEVNAANLWVDYCESFKPNGSCDYSPGNIVVQLNIRNSDIGLGKTGPFTLVWPKDHPAHQKGTHKVSIHAYYCIPGTNNCPFANRVTIPTLVEIK